MSISDYDRANLVHAIDTPSYYFFLKSANDETPNNVFLKVSELDVTIGH